MASQETCAMARPFFQDPHQHADGPPRRFGATGHPQRPPTPQQQRVAYAHPVGVLPALQSVLYVLVVALFLMTFTVQPIRIPSPSMEPTLLVGDFLLLDKQSSADDPPILPRASIERGDVIVFHDPVDDPSVHLVKRVIGLPGDRLHLRDGVVFVNGQPLTENYAVYRPAARSTFRDDFPMLETIDAGVNPAWWIKLRSLVRAGEVTVPAGNYFVMGDNRNDSEDSRYWGFVPREDIVGKPVLIYFSWNDRSGNDRSGNDRNRNDRSGNEPGAGRTRSPAAGPESGYALSPAENQGGPQEPGRSSNLEVRTPAGDVLTIDRASNNRHRGLPSPIENAGPTDFARWDRTLRVVR